MSKELVKALESSLSDNVVCFKLIDGTTIISLVDDNELFVGTIYLFAPMEMISTELESGEWEYTFHDWLIGAEDEVQYIDESKVVIWYTADKEMSYEYLEFAYPDHFAAGSQANDLSLSIGFLKDNSTVH